MCVNRGAAWCLPGALLIKTLTPCSSPVGVGIDSTVESAGRGARRLPDVVSRLCVGIITVPEGGMDSGRDQIIKAGSRHCCSTSQGGGIY